jgi:hypothetical protein
MINEKGNINNIFTGNGENNPFEAYGISKQNLFSVPEAYFDRLPVKIREKISAEPKPAISKYFLKWKFKPGYSIAAVSVFVVLIAVVVFFNSDQEASRNGFADLTVEQVVSEEPGILEYTNDYLLFDMLYSMSESEIDEILTAENGFETDMTNEEIYNYLTDEELSSELFYNL